MTYPKTLAASASYDIPPDARRITGITISNTGSGTVYYGDVPGPDLVRTDCTVAIAGLFITLPSAGAGLGIEPGMTASDGVVNVASGAVVTSVEGGRVNVSAANINTGTATVTFAHPAIATTNGHPLEPGHTLMLDTGLQHGLRLKADATGTTLVITTKRA